MISRVLQSWAGICTGYGAVLASQRNSDCWIPICTPVCGPGLFSHILTSFAKLFKMPKGLITMQSNSLRSLFLRSVSFATFVVLHVRVQVSFMDMARVHGQRNPFRLHAQGTQCLCCLKNYFYRENLCHHRKHSSKKCPVLHGKGPGAPARCPEG